VGKKVSGVCGNGVMAAAEALARRNATNMLVTLATCYPGLQACDHNQILKTRFQHADLSITVHIWHILQWRQEASRQGKQSVKHRLFVVGSSSLQVSSSLCKHTKVINRTQTNRIPSVRHYKSARLFQQG
jgi:hypothetical protein